jgi:D-alanine-D-alanine ligase
MSPQKLRVGVILGGRSGEHEVSLRSAQSVMAAMDQARYEIVPIAIDKQGRWLLGSEAQRVLAESGETPAAPADSSLIPRHESLRSVDVVFPVLHGPYGEDGTVQGLLELAHIPYVGCGVLASALAMDKAALVQRRRWENEPEHVLADVESRLTYPLFAKPANLGSSVGVSKATQRTELARALDQAARYDRRLLVEQGIDAREIEVSVLGNDDPIASVPGEIVPQREFYDYAAKYLDPGSELIIPAPLSPGLAEAARQMAVQAFLAIDGAGMARVDFLLERRTGQLYLSEVNTIPGFTSISMYPKLWEASGLSYPALIDRLIELALERYADKSRTVTSYRHGLEA